MQSDRRFCTGRRKPWFIGFGVAGAIAIIVVIIALAVTLPRQNAQSSGVDEDNDDPTASPANANVTSPFSNLTRLVTLSDSALQNKSRIFVIGDVHGCIDEFNTLVQTLNYNSTTDQIILAGDLVYKGPDSIGVIRRAMELGALCVRGNHDDKVIRFKTYELKYGKAAMKPGSTTMPEGNVPDPMKFGNTHAKIAKNMTQSDYDYLVSCPLILQLGNSSNNYVVHGGLQPNIALSQQIPYYVMTMRDIDNGVPTPLTSQGQQWVINWNAAQDQANPSIVYYGHDAHDGLNIRPYTFGVDSGCVYGRKLTALEIRTHSLTQVACKKYAT